MVVKGVICGKCGDFLYSRAAFDFRYCSCEATFSNGGTQVLRYGFTTRPPIIKSIRIDATDTDLYQDWDKSTNKFGLILKSDFENADIVGED